MKFYLTSIFLFITACFRVYATDVEAGHLNEAVADLVPASTTTLSLSGSMDARDFKFLADNFTALKSLDISNVSILEYSSKDKLFGNFVHYPAGELPPCCFMGMGLTSVALPSELSSIGDGAFAGCSELTTIALPSSLFKIGDYAFSGYAALVSVTGGENLMKIGDYAFSKCPTLTSVPVETVSEIGAYAFLGDAALKSISFSVTLSSIGEGAFKESGLQTVDLSQATGLTTIGAWAFADNAELVSITLPESVNTVGEGAFFYNSALNTITLPQNVAIINNFAFGNVENITNKDFLPAAIKTIGDYAFTDWADIVNFVIPSSVEYIGSGAFRNWTALALLEAAPATPPALGEDVWEGVDKSGITLTTLPDAQNLYKSADQWKDFFFSAVEENIANSDIKVSIIDNILTVLSPSELASVTIYDLSGIVVMHKNVSGNKTTLNLGGLNAKVYVVRCTLASGKTEFIKIGIK